MKTNIVLPVAIGLILFASNAASLAQDAANPPVSASTTVVSSNQSPAPDIAEITRTAAVASARESARIQFERDIGLAEAELAVAKEVLREESANADRIIQSKEARYLSSEFLGQAAESLRRASTNVQNKKNRRDFLVLEAKRLNILFLLTGPSRIQKLR